MKVEFNPQISQITQIIMNVRWRLQNLSGLIPRSLLRGISFINILGFDPTLIVIPVR